MSIATRWARRKLAVIVVCSVVLYYILSSSYSKYQIDTIIHRTKPEAVWEYVADFSKMKKLNPTM